MPLNARLAWLLPSRFGEREVSQRDTSQRQSLATQTVLKTYLSTDSTFIKPLGRQAAIRQLKDCQSLVSFMRCSSGKLLVALLEAKILQQSCSACCFVWFVYDLYMFVWLCCKSQFEVLRRLLKALQSESNQPPEEKAKACFGWLEQKWLKGKMGPNSFAGIVSQFKYC